MIETNTSAAEFIFDVRLTTADLRSALLAWQLRRKWTWFLFGLGLLALLSCLPEFWQHHNIPPAAFIGIAWLALPFLLAVLGARKSNQAPDGLADAHYQISESGIKRTTNGTAVELTWNILFGLCETSKAFLVLTNKNCFFVIPKRIFADVTELQRFHDFLKAKLAPR